MFVNAFIIVFRNKRYALLAGVVALIVFAFAVWLPNIRLIFSIITDSTIPVYLKLTFPIHLLESITINFTTLSASYTIVIAILFGIDMAMLSFFLRTRIAGVKQSGIATGFFGIASGILGMGCAACGSFILTSVLSLVGASSILAFLPLKGEEFGIIGVILLLASLYLTAKQIPALLAGRQNSAVCKIN